MPKITVCPPQTRGRHFRRDGMKYESHVDRVDLAGMAIVQVFHGAGNEPRRMGKELPLQGRLHAA